MQTQFQCHFADYLSRSQIGAEVPKSMTLQDFVNYLEDPESKPIAGLGDRHRDLFKSGARANKFWTAIVDVFINLTMALDMEPQIGYSLRQLLVLYAVAHNYVVREQTEDGKRVPRNDTMETLAVRLNVLAGMSIPALESVLNDTEYVKRLFRSAENPPAPPLEDSRAQPKSIAELMARGGPRFNVTAAELDAASQRLEQQRAARRYDTIDEISYDDFLSLILQKARMQEQPIFKNVLARYDMNHQNFDVFWSEVASRWQVLLSETGFGPGSFPMPIYFGQFLEVLQEAALSVQQLWTALRRTRPMVAGWTDSTSDIVYRQTTALAERLFRLEQTYATHVGRAPRLYGPEYAASTASDKVPARTVAGSFTTDDIKSIGTEVRSPKDGWKFLTPEELAAASGDAKKAKEGLTEEEVVKQIEELTKTWGDRVTRLVSVGLARNIAVLFHGAPLHKAKIDEALSSEDDNDTVRLVREIFKHAATGMVEEILATIADPGMAALQTGAALGLIAEVNRHESGGKFHYEVVTNFGDDEPSNFMAQGHLHDALVKLYPERGDSSWMKSNLEDWVYARVAFHLGEDLPVLQLKIYREA